MNTSYQPKAIETQAQAFWEQQQSFHTDTQTTTDRSKHFYCLSMFPYTSGNIHMGHVRNYTIGDVMTRIKKMQGFAVLQPMGWDSFGLPAENAAIKGKRHPATWTRENIASMKQELKRIGFGYDWSRELATCDESYYRWQQWLFIQMLERGLVYRKAAIVNWDPVDQTVLANEQVVNGRGWRSNALVEQKHIPQWFCRITDYADRLSDDLDTLTDWPEAVKIMQKNWIGKSKGARIVFALENRDETLEVFTTRPDTLFGASFMAIASDHPLAIACGEADQQIAAFIQTCKQQSTAEADIATAEKIGIATPLMAINPINGQTIPVWIANYILMGYGTGAIMAVPAEDERDAEFAAKYQLPVVPVYDYEAETPTLINADRFTGLSKDEAVSQIIQALTTMQAGQASTTYRLRDWGISRQRYWGVPIPIIYCDDCGAVPEKTENLPVKLPIDITYAYGEPLLKQCQAFYHTTCPQCDKPAHRETDTFDTFFDSSWYYHYFINQGQGGMATLDNDQWLGVDLYIGGIEHAILHLLYARFIQKVLKDLNLSAVDEPFKQLLSQGMVLKDGAKMSKSKGNVISPNTLIEQYGADTIRLFMIFAAPPTQDLDWSDGAVEGCFRFLKRIWTFAQTHRASLQQAKSMDFHASALSPAMQQCLIAIHQELTVIQRDVQHIQLNTVASGAMKLFQSIQKITVDATHAPLARHAFSILLRVLNPITPHLTQFLWQDCHYGEDIATANWPEPDHAILQLQANVSVVVQFNGKKKAMLAVDKDATEAQVLAALEQDEQANHHYAKHKDSIRKTIYVKNKLINFVV